MSEEILTGKIKYFDWQKGEGRLIQKDGTELFFNLKGGRIPENTNFDGVSSVTWKKPVGSYPRGRLIGEEIQYKIHRGPQGKFAKKWVLKKHLDLLENE